MATSRSREDDTKRTSLAAQLRWAAGAARLTLREPGDGLDRAVGRARRLVTGSAAPRHDYEPDPEWERHLPALDTAYHSEIAAAVPSDLRSRWTYLNGTSRRRLPPLLAELGEIDLFVHDSSHTTRNDAFGDFMRSRPDVPCFVAAADDSGALFGIALKGF
jgi:hypothetical protein